VATISILLPLTFGMQPVPAILMLSGVYYGAQYAAPSASILRIYMSSPHAGDLPGRLSLASRAKAATALGITYLPPLSRIVRHHRDDFPRAVLVKMAPNSAPAEVCSLCWWDCSQARRWPRIAAQGHRDDGFGSFGRDRRIRHRDRTARFTFGITELFDGVEIIALALGMFGIAEFMNSINNTETVD